MSNQLAASQRAKLIEELRTEVSDIINEHSAMVTLTTYEVIGMLEMIKQDVIDTHFDADFQDGEDQQ